MAVALSWTGYVDTGLEIADFWAGDHTIVLRFMPQFPDAYQGPFIAENGSGTFAFGMGDYGAPNDGDTKLMLVVGTVSQDFTVPLQPATWHHAALSVDVGATARVYRVYVDGTQVGSSLSVPNTTAQLPAGTVRLGKRTTGQTFGGRNAQFYGLLDEIGVFGSRLSAAEIATLAAAPRLTGAEAGLSAGVLVDGGRRRSSVAKTFSLHGAATAVTVSETHDSAADGKLLPLPTAHQPMDLPFPPGEAWSVIQGVDFQGGSHRGYACFCWDFVVADQPQSGTYPNGSDGAPFYAAAPGEVRRVREVAPPGPAQYSNYVEVEQAPDEICAYLHLRQNSALPAQGDVVTMGQQLALTGDTGTGLGAHHPHVAVADDLDQSPGFVTFPVAFSDYEVRTRANTWKRVARGMPETGQVVRNAPTPQFGPRGLGVDGVVARSGSDLDVIATDVSGQAWRAHWTPGRYAGNWDRWRPLLGDMSPVNTPVSVVALDDHRLDMFLSGSDGKTYTAAWDERVANGQWRGWWNILTGHIPPGGAVTAVSRGPNKLDVFLVSNDGGVYTAAWDPNVADGKWQGWWRIGDLEAKPGSPVGVVARDPNKLDVFVAGADGKTYTAAWDSHVAEGKWRGWWNILTGRIEPGSAVAATSRAATKLDIFIVSTDKRIYTAAWDPNVADGKWQGWWRIG